MFKKPRAICVVLVCVILAFAFGWFAKSSPAARKAKPVTVDVVAASKILDGSVIVGTNVVVWKDNSGHLRVWHRGKQYMVERNGRFDPKFVWAGDKMVAYRTPGRDIKAWVAP